MADVWANSMACHPRATYHIAGWCHLVNSLSRFQSHICHIAGCSYLTKSMSWSCHIAGCKNFICHIENRFSPYILFYFFLFLMQFRLWRAAAFVSSPIHLFPFNLSDHPQTNFEFLTNNLPESLSYRCTVHQIPPMSQTTDDRWGFDDIRYHIM